jgi:ABC-2 type transport system permease protein
MASLALVRALWRVYAEEELQYRANFVASLLGTAFWLATAMLTVAIFFSHTPRLGGWSFWEVVVLLGVFNALAGLVEAMLRPSIGQLVEDVRMGTLDLVLARPVEAQVYVSFRRLDIWRITDIVLGLGLSLFALVRLGRAPGVLGVLAFLVTLLAAGLVVYSLWIALMSLSFWFVSVENLAVLFDAVFEAARYPVSAYPGALRFLFVYLIPIAWTTTIPASALTGRLDAGAAAVALGVAGVAMMLSRLFWRSALRRYTSAGG